LFVKIFGNPRVALGFSSFSVLMLLPLLARAAPTTEDANSVVIPATDVVVEDFIQVDAA
jgi:hypothetical protein